MNIDRYCACVLHKEFTCLRHLYSVCVVIQKWEIKLLATISFIEADQIKFPIGKIDRVDALHF